MKFFYKESIKKNETVHKYLICFFLMTYCFILETNLDVLNIIFRLNIN